MFYNCLFFYGWIIINLNPLNNICRVLLVYFFVFSLCACAISPIKSNHATDLPLSDAKMLQHIKQVSDKLRSKTNNQVSPQQMLDYFLGTNFIRYGDRDQNIRNYPFFYDYEGAMANLWNRQQSWQCKTDNSFDNVNQCIMFFCKPVLRELQSMGRSENEIKQSFYDLTDKILNLAHPISSH